MLEHNSYDELLESTMMNEKKNNKFIVSNTIVLFIIVTFFLVIFFKYDAYYFACNGSETTCDNPSGSFGVYHGFTIPNLIVEFFLNFEHWWY